LILVFSLLNNVHYIYRINEYVSEDTEVVNNLLNTTIIQTDETTSLEQQKQQSHATTTIIPPQNTNLLTVNTPQTSKKRVSVSPIISTHSFYNKLSINSPLITNTASSITSSTTTTTTTTTTNTLTTTATTQPALVTAHHHFMQRNFSPMAALSRSPSCSSSPSVMVPSTVRRTLNNQVASQRPSTSNSLQVIANNLPLQFTTPMIEVNNNPYIGSVYKTPLSAFYQHQQHQQQQQQQQNTPMNSFRRTFTPYSAQVNNNNNNATFTLNMENSNEAIHEQMMPEYCLELIWTEPVIVAGDSSFNEKATKFFYINDLYNQKYVCYLMPSKTQLRCLKIENTNDQTKYQPVGTLNYIPARDAVFVENRNLMVIIDNLGSLVVYSGLTKLCKLQLHNIVWSMQQTQANLFSKQNKDLIQSPIITPIKSKLFNNSNSFFKQPPLPPPSSSSNESTNNNNEQNNSFKTPKQSSNTSTLFSKAIQGSAAAAAAAAAGTTTPTTQLLLLPQQQEYKSVRDSTGSRFSVKLNDNRLVRVNLNESSTCKLVSMCLEAFKYALNKDIYYEIIQQWYIHRYTAGDQSIRDQLNLFFYLILNLCGCFDMAKLDQELPFLINHSVSSSSSSSSTNKSNIIETNQSLITDSDLTKRSKCQFSSQSNESADWEFLLNDNSLNKNLLEFNFNDLLNKIPTKQHESQVIKQDTTTTSNNESLPPTGLRIKRSIGLTSNNSAKPLSNSNSSSSSV